jgi:hypothetical protein
VQEVFRTLKNDVDVFVNQVKSYRRALTTLSEDDEAMALMNLSILKEAPWYYTAPLRPEILACREGVEELIESYSMEINTLLVRLDNLCSRLDHAEENVRRHLTMAQVRAYLTVCTCGRENTRPLSPPRVPCLSTERVLSRHVMCRAEPPPRLGRPHLHLGRVHQVLQLRHGDTRHELGRVDNYLSSQRGVVRHRGRRHRHLHPRRLVVPRVVLETKGDHTHRAQVP